jgi:hypothetical protein
VSARVARGAGALAVLPAALVALLAALAGCASLLPQDPLRARPYVWASAGQVELLACRWAGEAPIPVTLAPGASPAEERALDTALASLTGVGPGVRFLRVGADAATLRVRFVDAPVTRADGTPGTGRSIADCALAASGAHAALVAAEVELARRTPADWRGAPRALSAEERMGALLHELAHALGVAGHAAYGDDLLAAAPEAARRVGRRALAGEKLASPALAALYARPSGEVLVRQPVEAWRTRDLDRLAKLAAEQGVGGPYLRAGDLSGRIFWRDAAGREWGFLVADLAHIARDPRRLLLLPEAATRSALPRRPR